MKIKNFTLHLHKSDLLKIVWRWSNWPPLWVLCQSFFFFLLYLYSFSFIFDVLAHKKVLQTLWHLKKTFRHPGHHSPSQTPLIIWIRFIKLKEFLKNNFRVSQLLHKSPMLSYHNAGLGGVTNKQNKNKWAGQLPLYPSLQWEFMRVAEDVNSAFKTGASFLAYNVNSKKLFKIIINKKIII